MSDETVFDSNQHELPSSAYLRARKWGMLVAGSPANVIPSLSALLWQQSIAFAQSAPQDNGADGWTSIGPRNVGGSVRAIVQDPDPAHLSTFYTGLSGGGLWRTNDDGNTWEPLGDAFFGVVPVCALAVAPSDRNVIWVGTGEPSQFDVPGVGLWRSVDGGVTFQKLANPGSAANGDADHFNRIIVHPEKPLVAYVATETGLWRWNNTAPTLEQAVGIAQGCVTDLAVGVDPGNARQLLILAGLYARGVQRGVINLDAANGAVTWDAAGLSTLTLTTGAAPPANRIGRIRLAYAPSNRNVAYAMVHDRESTWAVGAPPVAGAGTGAPQRMYASADQGRTFRQPAGAQLWPADTPSTQAFYSMVLEVHPTQPQTVVAGHVNLYVSRTGGRTWQITGPNAGGWISWQNNLTFGTVAEHGDMHAIVFDKRDAAAAFPRIWVGNDGGLSTTNQWNAPFNWRKRSYGVLGAQAVDGTSHPAIPSMMGIGMQDNATFVTYGGPTWYQVGMADGGAIGWNPANPRQAHMSWQFAVARLQMGTAVGGAFQLRQPLPEVAPPGGALGNNLISSQTQLAVIGAGGFNTGSFRQLIVADPVTANRVIVSGTNGAFLSTSGNSGTFNRLATGGVVGGNPVSGFTAAPPGLTAVESSAFSFVPGNPSNRAIYVGTSTGDVFAPPTAAAPAPWIRTNPFTATGGTPPMVACIAVHPVKTNVVAACAYLANPPLLLSHDAGQTWFSASGGATPLPPGAPVTSLAWHPTDERVLYAGTMVGVFVARDLPAFVAAPGTATSATPTWRSFLRGMGPTWVNDLEVVNVTNTLRATTFARGAYEANLRGTGATYATPAQFQVPAVRLSIRDHVFDDSRTYVAANQVAQAGDPRLAQANPVPHLNGSQSFDIKVNAPELRDRTAYLLSERFGNSPDGAELDEQFANENPISGETNVVYVQVHNRGYQRAENVQCFLYAADAPGTPPAAPALTGLGFPAPPPAGFAWQLVGQQTAFVLPGSPRVFRFEWLTPLEIGQNAALLAICRSPDDEVTSAPAGAALTWAQANRQGALRIVPTVPDRLFIRDGLDDTGQRGAVVWGGRSPDLIVMTKTAADAITAAQQDNNATGPFANLADARRGDRVHAGNNTIFVRVSNRGAIAMNARVRLFQIPLNQITNGGAWTQIGGGDANITGIAARTWKMARFQITGVPADGVPGTTQPWQKAFVYAALVQAMNPAGGAVLETFPDVTTVTGVDEFWRLFTRGALGNNAAFRALRFGA